MKRTHPSLAALEGKYIKNIVYGGLDGTITTFAVVAGVSGASLSSGVLLILGFANLLADGISMAVGEYLSEKAEKEYREGTEQKPHPESEEGETEMLLYYHKQGVGQKDAEMLVTIMGKYKDVFEKEKKVEEEAIEGNPMAKALWTFFSFLFFGFLPLSAYLFALWFPGVLVHNFFFACVLTGLTLFTLGLFKGKITGKHWLRGAIEMLLVGGTAATIAFGVGHILARLG